MLRAVILIVIAMVSIQSGATLAKSIFPQLGPAGTSALRLLFATLILWAIWRPWRRPLPRSKLLPLAAYGASLGLMNLFFYYALEKIPLGIAVALEFLGPLSVAIFNSRKKVDFLWVLLAGLGIWLILPVAGATQLDPLGISFAVLAGAFWAGYIVFGQRAGSDLHGGLAATIGMTVAAAVVLPVGLVSAGAGIFHPSLLLAGLGVAVFSSALPYSLEMISLQKMPARTFGVLMSLEPVIAALAGLLFLGEALTLQQWVAILCVIVSSLGSTFSARSS
jgi:inner membrane transporter RhtA